MGLDSRSGFSFGMIAFICRAVAIFTLFIPILGIILIIAANITELIAWIKFKEIKKKEAL